MPPEFFVLSVDVPDGERFAIVRPDDFLQSARSQWGSADTWSTTLDGFMRALELLSEVEVRARLEEMGLGEDAVADHITRARKIRELNADASWERVTVVGFRNEEGQEVIARTSRTGSAPAQRVFVMRCTVCGHEYGSIGCEIPRRCCPNCQDGTPGEVYR